MHKLTALTLVAAALFYGAASAQPMAYRDGVRYTGRCNVWDQSHNAQATGPCAVDMEIHPGRGVLLPIRLTVFHASHIYRIAVFGNSLCTIQGIPCTFEDTGGDTMRVIIDASRGLEFPATR